MPAKCSKGRRGDTRLRASNDQQGAGVQPYLIHVRSLQFVINTFTVATCAESQVDVAMSVMGTGEDRR